MGQCMWNFGWEQLDKVVDFVVVVRLVGLAHVALLVIALLIIKVIGLRLMSELRTVSATATTTVGCKSSAKGWAKSGPWWKNSWRHISCWNIHLVLLLPHLRRTILHIIISWSVQLLPIIPRIILKLPLRRSCYWIVGFVWFFIRRLRWCHILILNDCEIVEWNLKLHTSSFIWFERRGVCLMVLFVRR